jgi:hypothetical protein
MKNTVLPLVAVLLIARLTIGQPQFTVNELVLRGEIGEQDALTTLDLFHEEKVLGPPLLQRITDGTLTVGRPRISRIASTRHEGDWAWYIIDQPFTLHRLEGERYYESAVFQVTLDNPAITAEDLFPKDVTTEIKIDSKLTITPSVKAGFKFGEASLSAGFEKTKSVVTLLPLIAAFGIGEREFYWEYKAPESQPLAAGTKQAAMILRVPRSAGLVLGKAAYRAVIVEKGFTRILNKRDAKTGDHFIRWSLTGKPVP